jgi:hypothetical protein
MPAPRRCGCDDAAVQDADDEAGTDAGPPPESLGAAALGATLGALRDQVTNVEKLLHLPGRAFTEVESRVVPAWRRRTAGEPRWAVSTAIVLAIALQVSLPPSLEMPPQWLLPTVGAALLVGLLLADPRVHDSRGRGLRATSVVLTGVLSLANAVSAGRLIVSLTRGTATEDAALLLRWGGAIWLTNVVVFALWYWELDRGGPAARACGEHEYPDLLFTQMTAPELAPPDWEPLFLDYLYLAFTNATAFSPTDVLPLTRWAKMMMLLQSAVSVSTLVLVVSRAVNILQ